MQDMQPNPNNFELKVNPQDLKWMSCPEGAQTFHPALVFKRLPALLSPTGNEEVIPADVMVCNRCQKVPKFIWSRFPDFPEELKSTCEE
jgi:hypothetical protein